MNVIIRIQGRVYQKASVNTILAFSVSRHLFASGNMFMICFCRIFAQRTPKSGWLLVSKSGRMYMTRERRFRLISDRFQAENRLKGPDFAASYRKECLSLSTSSVYPPPADPFRVHFPSAYPAFLPLSGFPFPSSHIKGPGLLLNGMKSLCTVIPGPGQRHEEGISHQVTLFLTFYRIFLTSRLL